MQETSRLVCLRLPDHLHGLGGREGAGLRPGPDVLLKVPRAEGFLALQVHGASRKRSLFTFTASHEVRLGASRRSPAWIHLHREVLRSPLMCRRGPKWEAGSSSLIIIIICCTLIFCLIDADHLMCLHSARYLGYYDERDKLSMVLQTGRDG